MTYDDNENRYHADDDDNNDDDGEVVGMFTGLESSLYEYVAKIIAPYRPNLQLEIGTLLIVQNIDEDIVARIMDYAPSGEFTTTMGEKWLSDITAQEAIDEIGHDIKKSKITYKVRIKVLGSIREGVFTAGLKRIPQITSKVRLPSRRNLQSIISKALKEQENGVHIGHYVMDEDIPITFDESRLNSKRTFVFARAGYGKSNLMKLICNEWSNANGGLLVFDQDGEYAVTDKAGRPGIMDGREAILITNQKMSGDLANVYPINKINLADQPHKMIIPVMVNPAKHKNVFFGKLMSMKPERWSLLVDLLYKKGWSADYEQINDIVTGGGAVNAPSEVDIKPILNNLVPPINSMHDPDSMTIAVIERALHDGLVVIFDISRLDSQTARWLSAIIVTKIFNYNKENFIQHGGDDLIKATFVLEEAHNVLGTTGGSRSSSSHAFVDLAKEGRKYNLGGIFITQQPGSIPADIISQGDNFFVFHLLSRTDLKALSDANAHYSNDIITQILNEPIRGKSYMWTSHQPFVIPIMVRNFEDSVYSDCSIDVQSASTSLADILSKASAKNNDVHTKSIFEKFVIVVEKPNIGSERIGPEVFRLLSNEERVFLKSIYALENDDDDKPFTIRHQYLRMLNAKYASSKSKPKHSSRK